MKRESKSLPWTVEKGFVGLYFERYLQPYLYLPNGVFYRHNMDHVVVFMTTLYCGNIIR